jgi:hypothetical protein
VVSQIVGTGDGKHWGEAGGMSGGTMEKKREEGQVQDKNRMTFVPTMCRFMQTMIEYLE